MSEELTALDKVVRDFVSGYNSFDQGVKLMDEASMELAQLRATIAELETQRDNNHHVMAAQADLISKLRATLAQQAAQADDTHCPLCTWRGPVELVNGVCPQCGVDWPKKYAEQQA